MTQTGHTASADRSGHAYPDLPRSVALLWGLAEPGKRGPKRGLTLDQVVDAAVEVADAEGFAALSMARIAKQLSFTTMSLYRYVDSKDTLIALVMDRVIGVAPDISPKLGWRAALEKWAWAQFVEIRKHPWWLDAPFTAPPQGPNNMSWLEAGLRAFQATKVPEPVKLQLLLNLTFYVSGRMRLMLQLLEARKQDDDNYVTVLTQVLDPEKFPAITAALSQQAFHDDDVNWEDGDFTFALDRLLDGYEKFVGSFG
jgi:AcrR family transcriptional regulator